MGGSENQNVDWKVEKFLKLSTAQRHKNGGLRYHVQEILGCVTQLLSQQWLAGKEQLHKGQAVLFSLVISEPS